MMRHEPGIWRRLTSERPLTVGVLAALIVVLIV